MDVIGFRIIKIGPDRCLGFAVNGLLYHGDDYLKSLLPGNPLIQVQTMARALAGRGEVIYASIYPLVYSFALQPIKKACLYAGFFL